MDDLYFEQEKKKLIDRYQAIMDDIDSHREEDDFETFMEKIHSAIAVVDEMHELDLMHQESLLEKLESGSLDAIQKVINMVFGIGS